MACRDAPLTAANAYLRMIENRFVTTESTFIDMAWWDACVDPQATPTYATSLDRRGRIREARQHRDRCRHLGREGEEGAPHRPPAVPAVI